MASSTEGAFPQPVAITETEWRALLTAVVGPRRSVFGEIFNIPALTGEVVRLAKNTGTQPVLILVQVTIAPGTVVFGRGGNVTLLNGQQHAFAVNPTFEQILLGGEELHAASLGIATTFIVLKTLV